MVDGDPPKPVTDLSSTSGPPVGLGISQWRSSVAAEKCGATSTWDGRPSAGIGRDGMGRRGRDAREWGIQLASGDVLQFGAAGVMELAVGCKSGIQLPGCDPESLFILYSVFVKVPVSRETLRTSRQESPVSPKGKIATSYQ